jgi:hypothetical protein
MQFSPGSCYSWEPDSSVGIGRGSWLDGRDQFPAEARDFSLLHSVKTGSEVHPASYKMGTGGSFRGVKADAV